MVVIWNITFKNENDRNHSCDHFFILSCLVIYLIINRSFPQYASLNSEMYYSIFHLVKTLYISNLSRDTREAKEMLPSSGQLHGCDI